MKNFILILLTIILFISCEENETFPESYYACQLAFADSSSSHPKSAFYQEILDRNRRNGIVGASMMIKDSDGVWIGASGKADIASDIDIIPCNSFLIASISKPFTAATIFHLIDEGKLKLNDPVNKWINKTITDKLENANNATIRHLLNHTSGLADYYTLQFELDRINKKYNDWKQEDILSYAYGKSATNTVGESYFYSNTNFLLLGMIIENASGVSLEEAYQQKIFIPANLPNTTFSINKPIPDGNVKGYVEIYGNGQFVESEFLYKDELRTADGGIATNAYELGLFFEKLLKAEIISQVSLDLMTTYEDLPGDWIDGEFGHFKNGLGLEYNKTPYGNSTGHTGSIDGFLSIAQYFPEQDATFILLVNSKSSDNSHRLNIYRETLEVMFE